MPEPSPSTSTKIDIGPAGSNGVAHCVALITNAPSEVVGEVPTAAPSSMTIGVMTSAQPGPALSIQFAPRSPSARSKSSDHSGPTNSTGASAPGTLGGMIHGGSSSANVAPNGSVPSSANVWAMVMSTLRVSVTTSTGCR